MASAPTRFCPEQSKASGYKKFSKVGRRRAAESIEEIENKAMAAQSIKRLVDPRDIAALAVFLASDASKSLSGQMLPIDNDMQKAS